MPGVGLNDQLTAACPRASVVATVADNAPDDGPTEKCTGAFATSSPVSCSTWTVIVFGKCSPAKARWPEPLMRNTTRLLGGADGESVEPPHAQAATMTRHR